MGQQLQQWHGDPPARLQTLAGLADRERLGQGGELLGGGGVRVTDTGEFQERASRLGHRLATGLTPLVGDGAAATRVHGLWAGVDIPASGPTARIVCERLLERGVLAKDAHGHTLRIAPPIVIAETDLDFAIEQLAGALRADFARIS